VTDDQPAEIERLRRQLRAMSAVTRQLYAQLEALRPTSQLKPRRHGLATEWVAELERTAHPAPVELYVTTDGAVWLREGGTRRGVKSGLLAAALEHQLGPRRTIDRSELEQWVEGPPVEVLEAVTGPPFLVVGGQRLPVRGLPAPFPVPLEAVIRFPEGPELDLRRTIKGGSWAGPSSGVRSVGDLGELARRAGRTGKRYVRRATGAGQA
jgi:hypothetical protein